MRGEIGGGIQLDGMQVYDRAVRMMSDTVNRLRDNDIEPTVVVGHQANSRILQKSSRRGRRRATRNSSTRVEQFGNTSRPRYRWRWVPVSPSSPIPATGRMTLVAYGAGEAWGGVSVDYDLADAMAPGARASNGPI